MSCQRGGVTQDDEFHPCAGYRHVHPSQVAQESYLTLVVGTHQRYYYHVAFLSLESVNGVHGDEVTVGFEELVFLYQPPQILHLCAVGRYYAYVDALVEQPLFAYLAEVGYESGDGELGFLSVDAAEVLAHKLLLAFEFGRVYPRHWAVEVEYSAVFYLWCGGYLSVIEPLVGETHYLLVHTILIIEKRHHLWFTIYDALHKSFS